MTTIAVIYFSVFSTLLFGGLAIYFSYKEEKKKKELITEKNKLESFISSLPSGAILFNKDDGHFNLSVINSAAKDFLNINDGTTTDSVFKSFGEENRLQDRIEEVLSGKKSLILREVLIANKYFHVIITPVFFHETEKIIGVSVILRSIELEKELEKLRENFTHIIVHELRAPAASIRGAIDLILSDTIKDEDKVNMLHVAKTSSERMLSDISELLDSAKLESGNLSVVKEVADFNDIIKKSVDLLSFQARVKHINIFLNLQKNIPESMLDSARIGQVVNNLVSNSIKFTPEDGKITIKSSLEGRILTLLVEDTGIGIPEDKKPYLFSKFANIGKERQKDSSGLGLYITKGIVEAHGGKIWVESSAGEGTKVFVQIPLEEASGLAEKEKSAIVPEKYLN